MTTKFNKSNKSKVDDVDFSHVTKDISAAELAKKSGLEILDEVVREQLDDYISDYFFEYSVLCSTINPQSHELYSFAAARNGDTNHETFAENVGRFVVPIINALYPSEPKGMNNQEIKIETLSKNWFHNPELFLFPTTNHVQPFIIGGDLKLGEERDLVINDEENTVVKINSLVPNCPKKFCDNGEGLFVENMTYRRQLEEMLHASRLIYMNAKGLIEEGKTNNVKELYEVLLDEYHDGARILKHYYDKFLCPPECSNEDFLFVTFPIMSSSYSNLPTIYEKYYGDFEDINKRQQGLGHFFLYCKINDVFKSKTLTDKKKIINLLFDKVNKEIIYMSSVYIYNTGLQLTEKARLEAIKSAKAAIMARNLSHNLGSHVMSYMKQDLSSVEDMISRRVLEEAYSKKDFPSGDVELPYLVGIGKFISYLQERQDYIATVSTDYIPYPSAVNFKDAIYDELNPDYRFQRHSEWKGHKPTNILLENIAKSEGLSRENGTQKGNNIIIKYGKFDGLNHDGDGKDDYDKLRQWNFSLPGGIMGRHAVFSIVENVIRNAAKHSSRTQDEDLTLTFDIKDPILEKDNWIDDSFFSDYLNKEDTSDLYVVTLTNSAKTDKKRINFINSIVCDPFANVGEDLTASNKGLKEMVISAAWLRNIRIEEENINSNKVPILRARSEEGHLQYVFCLPKVKEVALITSYVGLLDAAKSELWKKNGWYAYSVEDYKKLSSKNFNFILLDNNLNSRKDEIRKCSNNRFFVAANEINLKQGEVHFDMSECTNYNSDDNFRKTEEDLFQQLANLNGEKVEKIAISDGGEVNTGNCDYVCAMPDEQKISEKEYIYRKHNDTETDFLGFLANISGCDTNNLMPALNKVKFIEGITGGNSTDRLIRRNVRDVKWFYQHLHAMNTKVAIFDERLFTKISGYEMSQLHEGKGQVIDWNKRLEGKSASEAIDELLAYDEEHSDKISYEEIPDDNSTLEAVIDLAKQKYPSEAPVNLCSLKSIAPLVYDKKGISVFTWTQVDKSKFAIWGLKNDFSEVVVDKKDMKLEIGSYGQVEKIAELTIEADNKPKVYFVGSRTYDFDFDYISIHQGLLDKIYEKMNPDGENKLAAGNKMMVTKAIHKNFAQNCGYEDNDYLDYLPGLAIHSGRSKPNADDMPQHQPFIQYSAIENAVFDCKYTLVELLDFACYE